MSNEMTTQKQKQLTAMGQQASQFRGIVTKMATSLLKDWVGEERAGEAVGRIASALSAAAASSRNPTEFYLCTHQSVGTCIALAALTGIMPGTGSTALAYVIPQRPRRNEAPQLEFRLSHRGVNALARRCGQTMIAIPIGVNDKISTDKFGQVNLDYRDIDNPPMTHEQLRGVMLLVKEVATGQVTTTGYLPKAMIEQRRAMSQSWTSKEYQHFSPWFTWPIEQAMKTAMHYAIGRGWCVIDDTVAAKALSADMESDLNQANQAPAKTVAGLTGQVQSAIEQDETIDVIPEQNEPESADTLDIEPTPAEGLFEQDYKPKDNSTAGLMRPHLEALAKCTTVSEMSACWEKASRALPPPLVDEFKTHYDAHKSTLKKTAK